MMHQDDLIAGKGNKIVSYLKNSGPNFQTQSFKSNNKNDVCETNLKNFNNDFRISLSNQRS